VGGRRTAARTGDGDAPQEAAAGKKGGREKKGREERSSPKAAADAEEEDGDDDCPMAACEDGGRTGSPLTCGRRRGSFFGRTDAG
jgi:hypothetical protein